MKVSRVFWFGVRVQEEPLKIWTRYKEKYGERNMVDSQRYIFRNMDILQVN